MAHSIELLLDPRSDAAIRAVWQALVTAGLPSQVQVKSATNRPHVTVLAAKRISPDVDEPLRRLRPRFPLACVVGAPLVFGGPRLTLARLIVPSAELLELHAEIYREVLPQLGGGPDGQPLGHCRPGRWTPHATLGRRYDAGQIGAALTVAVAAGADLPAEVVGLRRWDGDQREEHLLVG